MKLSRKLVPAIAMLLVSAVMLSTASFAWFSMNTTVNATGMQVQAQAMGSMIIHTDVPLSTTLTTSVVAVDKSATVLTLKDVTRDEDAPSGLKTIPAELRQYINVSNGSYDTDKAQAAVNASTEDALESIYTQINATDTTGYFKDYVVYISARADAIVTTGKALQATITGVDDTKYHNGISIDFYVERVAWGKDAQQATDPTDHPEYDSDVVKATFASNTAKIALNGTIPVAKGTANASEYGYLKVVMRVYIDGTNSNVNNAQWDATPVENIGVQFDLVDAQ